MYDIYLAAPFFNGEEIEIYEKVIDILRMRLGLKVFVPREHEIPNAWELSNVKWAWEVYFADTEAIRQSKRVVALNFGMYSDSGTAWEMGYATALGIPVTQVLCGGDNTVYSLMTLGSMSNVCDLVNFSIEQDTVNLQKVVQK